MNNMSYILQKTHESQDIKKKTQFYNVLCLGKIYFESKTTLLLVFLRVWSTSCFPDLFKFKLQNKYYQPLPQAYLPLNYFWFFTIVTLRQFFATRTEHNTNRYHTTISCFFRSCGRQELFSTYSATMLVKNTY